ncbi:MAG: CotH kinase family protein, partial [Lachnospiraceae bacterium]|nr:CotH kinase family protein [Lachnospiraceae bacterium]
MTENKHIGKIIYALVAIALAAVMTVSAAAKGLYGLDKTALGAAIKEAAGDTGVTQEYESKLFDTSEIMTVDIIMDDDKWQELLDNAIKEEYYECDVIINGERFSNVGIRAKGNTSLTNIAKDDTTDRYSFKLKFDEFVEGQTCYGLDKLVLNNNYADATNMNEAVIYDMYAYLGADASLYNYSKISVNGEYFGVYLALEGVEDSFMLRNYGTKSGNLYKPENMDFGDGPSDKRKPDWKPDWEKEDGDMPDFGDGKMPDFENGEKPDFKNGEMPEGFKPGEGFEPGEGFPGGGGPGGGPGDGPGGFGSNGGSNLEYTDDDLDSYSTIWQGEISS